MNAESTRKIKDILQTSKVEIKEGALIFHNNFLFFIMQSVAELKACLPLFLVNTFFTTIGCD